jgi:hypothetical protein
MDLSFVFEFNILISLYTVLIKIRQSSTHSTKPTIFFVKLSCRPFFFCKDENEFINSKKFFESMGSGIRVFFENGFGNFKTFLI